MVCVCVCVVGRSCLGYSLCRCIFAQVKLYCSLSGCLALVRFVAEANPELDLLWHIKLPLDHMNVLCSWLRSVVPQIIPLNRKTWVVIRISQTWWVVSANSHTYHQIGTKCEGSRVIHPNPPVRAPEGSVAKGVTMSVASLVTNCSRRPHGTHKNQWVGLRKRIKTRGDFSGLFVRLRYIRCSCPWIVAR